MSTKTFTAEQVYELLTTGGFEEWHNSDFEDHILGEEGCQSREQLIEVLELMLDMQNR